MDIRQFFFPSVDSFALFIPRECIGYIPAKIEDAYITLNTQTGDIASTGRIPDKIEAYGVSSKMFLSTRFKTEGLNVQFNSKQFYLGVDPYSGLVDSDRYFKGITAEAWPALFRRVLDAHGVRASFDKSNELGRCYDVDLKSDFHMDQLRFDAHISAYKRIPSCRTFKSKIAGRSVFVGCQFNSRIDARITSPFFKLYSKLAELETKSYEFYDSYLRDYPITYDYRRAESTVKNTAHFRSVTGLGDIVFSPNNLFSLSNGQLLSCLGKMYHRHTDEYPIIRSGDHFRDTGMRASDLALGQLAYSLMKETGLSRQVVCNIATANILDDSSKSRVKSRLMKCIDHFVELNGEAVKETKYDLFFVDDKN